MEKIVASHRPAREHVKAMVEGGNPAAACPREAGSKGTLNPWMNGTDSPRQTTYQLSAQIKSNAWLKTRTSVMEGEGRIVA